MLGKVYLALPPSIPMASALYFLLIGVGGLLSFVGAVFLYVGMKTPEGETVNWGLGTYYDRTGICFRAVMVLLIGIMALAIGFFLNA